VNWLNINRAANADMFVFWNVFQTDCRLLRYKTGAIFPPHNDIVDGYAHYRLNIFLRRGEGGKFVCDNPIWKWWRFVLFRSDLEEHSVEEVTKGPRYVLTLGLGLKQRESCYD
jgi:hypothetical protein